MAAIFMVVLSRVSPMMRAYLFDDGG